MKLLNRDEARKLDTLAMNTYGLPEAVLMENAGASVVALTEGDVSWKDARVVILCGSGNNGGDGFVTARYASLAEADVVVFLMGDESHMSDASRLYYQVCEKMVIPVRKIKKAEEAQPFLDDADIIVDALIGTGLRQGKRPILLTGLMLAVRYVSPWIFPAVSSVTADRRKGR